MAATGSTRAEPIDLGPAALTLAAEHASDLPDVRVELVAVSAVVGPHAAPGVACPMRRDPANDELQQPFTIALPGGPAIGVPPGSPAATPDAVTFDPDGAPPGALEQTGASALLWGAVTPGGPFAHIDRLHAGDEVVLRQGDRASQARVAVCEQRWRVVDVTSGSDHAPSPAPIRLELVGFTPTPQGPAVKVFVDLVPA